jgi:hypothetical protein
MTKKPKVIPVCCASIDFVKHEDKSEMAFRKHHTQARFPFFVFAQKFLGKWGKDLQILYSAYSHVHWFDSYKLELLIFSTCRQANCCFFVQDVANFVRRISHINPRWTMEMKCSSNTLESTASRIIVLHVFSTFRVRWAFLAIVRVKGKLWCSDKLQTELACRIGTYGGKRFIFDFFLSPDGEGFFSAGFGSVSCRSSRKLQGVLTFVSLKKAASKNHLELQAGKVSISRYAMTGRHATQLLLSTSSSASTFQKKNRWQLAPADYYFVFLSSRILQQRSNMTSSPPALLCGASSGHTADQPKVSGRLFFKKRMVAPRPRGWFLEWVSSLV